jgi:hypothetical protein
MQNIEIKKLVKCENHEKIKQFETIETIGTI